MLTELDDEAGRIITETGALAVAERANSVTITHLLTSLSRSTDYRLVKAFDLAALTSERLGPLSTTVGPQTNEPQVRWRIRIPAIARRHRFQHGSAVPYSGAVVNVLRHAYTTTKGREGAPIEPRHLLLAVLDVGSDRSGEAYVQHLDTPAIRHLLE